MHDVMGKNVVVGDMIAIVNDALPLFKYGDVHKVTKINELNLFVDGHITSLETIHFIKLNIKPVGTNYDLLADKLVKLNNAKPRNPTKEEIIACLQSL